MTGFVLPSPALREIVALARAENLTTYDASYLELAMRRVLPLATKDLFRLGGDRETHLG